MGVTREEARREWESRGLALAALGLVHQAWEEASQEWSLACAPGCAVCCSDRLALTTLEARALAQALEQGGQGDLLSRVAGLPTPPAPPQLTFNTLARLCLAQAEPPEEPAPSRVGPCPLLTGERCAVYAARPLGCRLMVSRQTCQAGESAWADPWWLTLATALHQVVEHLDRGGGYGLLPSVLAAVTGRPAKGVIACQPLPGIPAPAEHQAALQTTLERLLAQPLLDRPLGWWMGALE